MRQAHRLLAAGFAASIALSLPVSATTAAIAAPSASVEQSSQEAADYILANLIDGTPAGYHAAEEALTIGLSAAH